MDGERLEVLGSPAPRPPLGTGRARGTDGYQGCEMLRAWFLSEVLLWCLKPASGCGIH